MLEIFNTTIMCIKLHFLLDKILQPTLKAEVSRFSFDTGTMVLQVHNMQWVIDLQPIQVLTQGRSCVTHPDEEYRQCLDWKWQKHKDTEVIKWVTVWYWLACFGWVGSSSQLRDFENFFVFFKYWRSRFFSFLFYLIFEKLLLQKNTRSLIFIFRGVIKFFPL